MEFTLLYPGFKKKAFTFSYDDGIYQDERTIAILNSYGYKGTFNIPFGSAGNEKIRNGIDCSHFPMNEKALTLYKGHEIACHTYDHPHMECLPLETQRKEIEDNVKLLASFFKTPILGGAYPYGTYNEDTLLALKDAGLGYYRTTRSTYSFHIPYNFLLWNPTIHHRDPKLWETLEKFYKDDTELGVFYLWGHSYEFALDDNFELLEKFCKSVASHDDLINMTNGEIYSYVNAATMVYYRDGAFINPSSLDVYLEANGEKILVKAHSRLPYMEEKK